MGVAPAERLTIDIPVLLVRRYLWRSHLSIRNPLYFSSTCLHLHASLDQLLNILLDSETKSHQFEDTLQLRNLCNSFCVVSHGSFLLPCLVSMQFWLYACALACN